MDDVDIHCNSPQEDEWASCIMGVPSPYERVLFPRHPARFMDYLDMEGVRPAEVEQWKASWRWFLQCVADGSRQPLVLKSPTHTGRLHVLREMFPDAKFIHITRDPYRIFASTMRMWPIMEQAHGLQCTARQTSSRLREFVLTSHERMYASFHHHRPSVGKNQICDVRYEDLVAYPVAMMSLLYQHLDLGDFAAVRDRVRDYSSAKRAYQTNQYDTSGSWRSEVSRRWSEYFDRYGYPRDEARPIRRAAA